MLTAKCLYVPGTPRRRKKPWRDKPMVATSKHRSTSPNTSQQHQGIAQVSAPELPSLTPSTGQTQHHVPITLQPRDAGFASPETEPGAVKSPEPTGSPLRRVKKRIQAASLPAASQQAAELRTTAEHPCPRRATQGGPRSQLCPLSRQRLRKLPQTSLKRAGREISAPQPSQEGSSEA